MKKIAALFFILCLGLLSGCAPSQHWILTTGQHPQAFEKQITKTVGTRFLLFLPKTFGEEKKNWASQNPERFAAISPVCGGGDPDAGCRLKSIPVWAFHGAKDPVVPLKEDQEMVDAVKQCGGDVKFTVYPEAGHDAWTQTYNNPDLYTWFLSHKRSH